MNIPFLKKISQNSWSISSKKRISTRSLLARKSNDHVFLYGLKDELAMIGDLVYGQGPVPYTDFRCGRADSSLTPFAPGFSNMLEDIYTWQEAEAVTKAIASRLDFNTIPENLKTYDSLRCLGAGIQNTIDLEDWIRVLRHRLEAIGVNLITYKTVCKNAGYHKDRIRQEVTDSRNGIKRKRNTPKYVTNLPGKFVFRGRLINRNHKSQYANINDGVRKTVPNMPKDWSSTCHFFGASEVFGAWLKDTETVPSCFSSLVNDRKVRVFNHGMGGVNLIDVLSRLLTCNFLRGDTVFFALPFTETSVADCEIILDPEHFFDSSHLLPSGAQEVASRLKLSFDEPTCSNSQIDDKLLCFANHLLEVHRQILCAIEAKEFEDSNLKQYCEYLKDNKYAPKPPREGFVFGSVAVNCNPITKGHLSLIEYAASHVDHLYVLVIEEDKSAVKFVDRFNMVSEVCSDYDNISVLKGGKFICSEYIAPEYFVKDDERSENVDFSLESFYFGEYIAPCLNVTKIFLGEEPTCSVTRQYNEHMAATMPHYGIELTIIPRKTASDGNPISASKVRKLIKEDKWKEVEYLVPARAFAYMKDHPLF